MPLKPILTACLERCEEWVLYLIYYIIFIPFFCLFIYHCIQQLQKAFKAPFEFLPFFNLGLSFSLFRHFCSNQGSLIIAESPFLLSLPIISLSISHSSIVISSIQYLLWYPFLVNPLQISYPSQVSDFIFIYNVYRFI